MSWRPRELVTEAVRNLGPHQLGAGLVIALILTVFGLLTLGQARSALTQEWSRQEAGGLVWSASAVPESPLSGATCESLNQYGGVAAAGGITVEPPGDVRILPQTPALPAKGVTPHALRVWAANSPTTGVIIGTDLEELYRASRGSVIHDSSGVQATIDARTSPTVRPDQLNSHLLVVTHSDQSLTDCWVRMEPGAAPYGEELLKYAFGQNPGVQIVPYLAPLTGTSNPSQQWHSYADSHPWVLAGVLVALVLTFSVWSRRGEIAIYRAFGTPRTVVAALIALEAVLIILPAAAAAVLLSTTISAIAIDSTLGADPVQMTCRALASAALLGLALSIPLALLATRGNVTTQLKDR